MYNSQEMTKLNSKSKKCIFLGYADGVKGYHPWDPTSRKVVVSRDVIFTENELQEKQESDNTVKEIVRVQMDEKYREDDFSEVEPEHEEQELEKANDIEVHRSTRQRKTPSWYSDYVMTSYDAYCLLTEEGEPTTFVEVIHNPEASMWMTTMQEEIEALRRNHTWKLVALPTGRKAICNKWVYKIKRYHARLVVKRYAQKEGVDFNEIFSPVVRLTTIRVVLAMCAAFNLHLEQLDVKTAFLHEELEEEIYMLQP